MPTVLCFCQQLKKISEDQKLEVAQFDSAWHDMLSEYMLTQQTPFVRRQVRKQGIVQYYIQHVFLSP